MRPAHVRMGAVAPTQPAGTFAPVQISSTGSTVRTVSLFLLATSFYLNFACLGVPFLSVVCSSSVHVFSVLSFLLNFVIAVL